MDHAISRRGFLAKATASAGVTAAAARASGADAVSSPGKPELLGGEPVRRTPFPSWPVTDAVEKIRASAGALAKA